MDRNVPYILFESSVHLHADRVYTNAVTSFAQSQEIITASIALLNLGVYL